MLHQGSCHCGFIKFAVTAVIDHVRQCNCSICTKRGSLNFRVNNNQLQIKTPLTDLSLYQWGTKTAKDYFCPTCGIMPFRKPSALTSAEIAAGKEPFDGWAINVRCIEGLDLGRLPIVHINGAVL